MVFPLKEIPSWRDHERATRKKVPFDTFSQMNPGGRTLKEAIDPMIQAHPYWESYDSVRAMITFIVIAPALVWFLGPVGILYALGVVVAVTLIYRLITACAGLLHPDVY